MRRSWFAMGALLGAGLATPAAAAPTLAELIADGFAIEAMTEGAISSTLTIALRRDATAFLCALDRNAPEPEEQAPCRLLAGHAYLERWETEQAAAAAARDKTLTQTLEAAVGQALDSPTRACALDVDQTVEEVAWMLEQAGFEPDPARQAVADRVFAGNAYSPLGDPSENILRSVRGGGCDDAAAEARLAEIRAARSAEQAITRMLRDREDCEAARLWLDRELEPARQSFGAQALEAAEARMASRGALEIARKADSETVRLTKGCP